MDQPADSLVAFAYGEHLEGPQRRSLGFRMLAPAEPEAWSAEVESLARHLQAAPYPEHWPPSELFCSVLLHGGQRLVAVARYGLVDHTPSQRRGGLEVIGVVAPAGLGVPTALAIYQWLRQRRHSTEDLHTLAGRHALGNVLAASPPQLPADDSVPVLPVRLWQDGTLLFAATAPSDPDHRLGLLEQEKALAWQWLPLVGADFPLATYARRGPLVAWTPHLSGVAVKLDHPAGEGAAAAGHRPGLGWLLGAALMALMVANLWATLTLPRRLPPPEVPAPEAVPSNAAPVRDGSQDRLVRALFRHLQSQGVVSEWEQSQLLAQYDRLAAADEHLRVDSAEGKAALGAISMLTRRGSSQVEASVRTALSNKGFDPKLIDLACQRIHEQLANAPP